MRLKQGVPRESSSIKDFGVASHSLLITDAGTVVPTTSMDCHTYMLYRVTTSVCRSLSARRPAERDEMLVADSCTS